MEKPLAFDPVWDNLYHSGQHLNRYPYDDVVSFIYRYAPKDLRRDKIKIFEVGFGAGNNLWFAAREGFDVYGIEASKPAYEYATKRFENENLKGDLIIGDCQNLPYDDNFFDIAINRLALPCMPKSAAKKAINEIHRCLKPNGVFYNNMFSDKSTIFGEKRDDGVYIMDKEKGWLAAVGQQTFYSEAEIKELHHNKWKLLQQDHNERIDLLNRQKGTHGMWYIVAQKTYDPT